MQAVMNSSGKKITYCSSAGPYSFLTLQDRSNAFHLCAVVGNIAIAQLLAPMMDDHLFDVNDSSYTALHWATQEGQLSMVEYLVKSCGFDLKAKDKVGLPLICLVVVWSIFNSLGLLILHERGMYELCDA